MKKSFKENSDNIATMLEKLQLRPGLTKLQLGFLHLCRDTFSVYNTIGDNEKKSLENLYKGGY